MLVCAASHWGFVFSCQPIVPLGIERLHGDWLLLMCCTDLCLEWLTHRRVSRASEGKKERLHAEWLVLICCEATDSTDVFLERVLAKSSVYMGSHNPLF